MNNGNSNYANKQRKFSRVAAYPPGVVFNASLHLLRPEWKRKLGVEKHFIRRREEGGAEGGKESENANGRARGDRPNGPKDSEFRVLARATPIAHDLSQGKNEEPTTSVGPWAGVSRRGGVKGRVK